MQVALSTIGKFHTFDLARQMHKRSALASIFSGYPWFKLKRDGLPHEKVKTFPYLHAPYMKISLRSTSMRWLWEWQDRVWFDRYVAWNLPACDLFCGLSGAGLLTSRTAKARGVKYICDRGSSHIRFQDRILREEYDRQGIAFGGVDPRIVDREEAEYDAADAITVPSTFSLNTFLDCGVDSRKIKLVPYGVDLNSFYPSAHRDDSRFDVLFVGNLSVRKGVPYLLEAFRLLDCERKHLTLAGTVSIELEPLINSLRDEKRVSIVGPVPQQTLKNVMSASHVLVLPSVEEGLALVQAQAMACGCPVIASENTGAQDLLTHGKEGFIVPIRDSLAIAKRLQELAADPDLQLRMSCAALNNVRRFGGWNEYGERMYQVFSGVCAA